LWPDIKRQDSGAATQGKRWFSRKHWDDILVFQEEAPWRRLLSEGDDILAWL
jgi:hypothetical protein